MCSTETQLPLPERQLLLGVAARSLRTGLGARRPLAVDPLDYPASLRVLRATFVTLHAEARLRGCIGVLVAHRPLVADVAHNAYAAAFDDPRFPPLARAEYARLDLHIAVLSPPQPLDCASEAELLRQLRPGVDGLVLEDGVRRGTFLPAVWESLPDPVLFLRHLKLKAGLPEHHWSPSLRVSRYTTESFGASVAEIEAHAGTPA